MVGPLSAVFNLLPGKLKHIVSEDTPHTHTYTVYSTHAWATLYAAADNNEKLSAIFAAGNCSLHFGTSVVKRL
jgi:hypothetical protein